MLILSKAESNSYANDDTRSNDIQPCFFPIILRKFQLRGDST